MKRILWVSTHNPLEVQIDALHDLFGPTEIDQSKGWKSAQDIVNEFRDGGYDEMVIVAPLSVISKVTELKLKPLWADMTVVEHEEDAHLNYRGRHYRFNGFRRIKRVALEFEEV